MLTLMEPQRLSRQQQSPASWCRTAPRCSGFTLGLPLCQPAVRLLKLPEQVLQSMGSRGETLQGRGVLDTGPATGHSRQGPGLRALSRSGPNTGACTGTLSEAIKHGLAVLALLYFQARHLGLAPRLCSTQAQGEPHDIDVLSQFRGWGRRTAHSCCRSSSSL